MTDRVPDRVIVSRHASAVLFIAEQLHPGWYEPSWENTTDNGCDLVWRPHGLEEADPEFHRLYDSVRVVKDAKQEDVLGRIVYGNVPLHLAALAAKVYAVEFTGKPPRGAEYSLKDMRDAGAKLVGYTVAAKGD